MRYLFISYVDRSGSTFLANSLSRFKEVMVCPEGEVLVKQLLYNPQLKSDPHVIYPHFLVDSEIKYWNLDKDLFDDSRKKIRNIDIFHTIVDSYRLKHKPTAIIVVFKAVELLDYYVHIRKINDDHSYHFLSIIRDCRAVFLSQLQTKYKKRSMNSNPMITAFQWNHQTERSLAYSQNHDFIIIQYEKLISNFLHELDRILRHADLRVATYHGNPKGDLFERLPPEQQKIHQSIQSLPDLAFLHKWQQRLPVFYIVILEKYCNKQLVNFNYPLSNFQYNKIFIWFLIWYYKYLIFLGISKY